MARRISRSADNSKNQGSPLPLPAAAPADGSVARPVGETAAEPGKAYPGKTAGHGKTADRRPPSGVGNDPPSSPSARYLLLSAGLGRGGAGPFRIILNVSSCRHPGTIVTDHHAGVPLDHGNPDGERIGIFGREIVAPARPGA